MRGVSIARKEQEMAKKQVKRRRVPFTLAGIEADTVCLMGDFNMWNEKNIP